MTSGTGDGAREDGVAVRVPGRDVVATLGGTTTAVGSTVCTLLPGLGEPELCLDVVTSPMESAWAKPGAANETLPPVRAAKETLPPSNLLLATSWLVR